ncbi:hypothetical protein BT96DRAFT_67552 [Gymnopus androsaceus JB14]|uniref:Uncharacterized protein n=1 Tax=Gymnopus androsaceus JB14 TaxID=1447944 RepID=A0A6A4HLE7_9AGAR|nr:hypothetical protein BT96DRAFT_67552 [Gymnopus androsaceus JB14]
MLFTTFLFSSLLIYLRCPRVATTLVNITVDDQLGDPRTHSQILYSPTDAWSIAPNCSHCPYFSSLSVANAYNQTWHESFFSSNVSSGAVRSGAPRSASFKFSEMRSIWNGSGLLSSNPDRHSKQLALLIQSGQLEGPDSIIILDSIVYSYDSSEGSSKANPLTTILGAVFGSLAALILVCGLLLFLRIRRRRRRPILHESVQSQAVTPWWRLNPFIFLSKTTSRARTAAVTTQRSGSSATESTQADSRTQSILDWQHQTQQATRSLDLAPQDMSEELSSYYENATATESRRVRTPPPPPRRYIIRNK